MTRNTFFLETADTPGQPPSSKPPPINRSLGRIKCSSVNKGRLAEGTPAGASRSDAVGRFLGYRGWLDGRKNVFLLFRLRTTTTRMPRLTHDDPDLVYACPCCDKAGRVNERTGRNVHKDPDRPFRCGDCGATFRIVVQREPYERSRDGTFEARHSKGVWDSHRERILAEHGMLSEGAAD